MATPRTISQLVSDSVHSDFAVVSDYINSGGYNLLGDKDKRLIMGDQSVPALNATSTVDHWFKLDKQGETMYDTLKLVISTSAVTQQGGTYARLVDGAGIFLMERVQVWHDGKQISDVHTDAIYSRYIQDNDGPERDVLFNAVGLGMSTSDRNAAAGAGQTFVLDLDEIFSYFNMKFPRQLLVGDLRIMLRMRAINDVVETDGSSPSFSITDCKAALSLVKSPTILTSHLRDVMNTGAGFAMHQVEPIMITKTESGVLQSQVDMTTLRGKDVVSIDMYTRSAPTSTDKGYATFTDTIKDYSMESANTYTHGAQFPVTKDLYRRLMLPNSEIVGMDALLENNLWVCSFSSSMEKQWAEGRQDYAGSKQFHQGDNKLTINYNSSFSGTLTVIIWRLKPTFINRGHLVTAQ